MARFAFQQMPVYSASLQFLREVDTLARRVPRSRWYFADQLIRASASISQNIAEGAGEFSRREKARFYRMALRSANECAAILDQLVIVGVLDQAEADKRTRSLDQIAGMLTLLIRSFDRKR